MAIGSCNRHRAQVFMSELTTMIIMMLIIKFIFRLSQLISTQSYPFQSQSSECHSQTGPYTQSKSNSVSIQLLILLYISHIWPKFKLGQTQTTLIEQ